MAEIEIARQTDRFLRRMQSALNVSASRLDDHRVGPAGGMVLLTLAEHQAMRLRDLALAMARDKSQLTKVLNGLEADNLVQRSPDPRDARASLLRLTPLGRELASRLETSIAAALDDILAPLTGAERRMLQQLLSKI